MRRRSLARGLRATTVALLASLAWACSAPPEDAFAHLRRGDAALAEGRYAQALAAYGHARELAPTDASVQRAMMRARVHLVAEDAARIAPDAFEDARYEAGVLLESDKPRAHVYLTALGNVLLRQGDVEGAKVKFAEALAADASSPLAHTALALVLMSRKEGAAQAKAELELALKARPGHPKALIALGQLLLAEGDATGASARLEEALRAGDDFGARMALGNARSQQQKPAEAAEQFQRAAQLDPKSAEALGALGQALLGAGRPEDAERALRASAQLRPDTGTATALGFALAQQKRTDQALGIFAQVLAEDAGAASALYGAGMASEVLGKNDQALDYYRRLLGLGSRGKDRQLVDLQREAQGRVTALTASTAAGAWAAPSARPAAPRATGPR